VMKDNVLYDGVKDYDIVWPVFEKVCTDIDLIKDVEKQLAEWEHLKTGNPAKDFAGVNLKGDSIHLSDFKGKYVYVDVWATWCNPCLGEIPSLMQIEERMKKNNIVFLFLLTILYNCAYFRLCYFFIYVDFIVFYIPYGIHHIVLITHC